MGVEAIPRTIEWVSAQGAEGPCARIIDQRKLPAELAFWDVRTLREMVGAVQCLAVRGAPALGVAGAMGVCLWACNEWTDESAAGRAAFAAELEAKAETMASARPTAVNLRWGVERALAVAQRALAGSADIARVRAALVDEALAIAAEDEAANRAIGAHGAALLPEGARVLTHCNAGSLATAFYGTALGVVYAAFEQGKLAHVFADETRPVGQGARLTMWELSRAGVPCSLQCDGMAAILMASGQVDAVVVGADRIAANGDTANKVGTYQLAIAAAYHGVPFYVAAPTSTIDFALESGAGIPIEHRDAREVIDVSGFEVDVFNPAFDVTPAELIAAIVTERGAVKPDALKTLQHPY